MLRCICFYRLVTGVIPLLGGSIPADPSPSRYLHVNKCHQCHLADLTWGYISSSQKQTNKYNDSIYLQVLSTISLRLEAKWPMVLHHISWGKKGVFRSSFQVRDYDLLMIGVWSWNRSDCSIVSCLIGYNKGAIVGLEEALRLYGG